MEKKVPGFNSKESEITQVDELNNYLWERTGDHLPGEIKKAKLAVKLAKKNNYLKGLAFSYLNMGWAYYYAALIDNAFKFFKESEIVCQEIKDHNGELRAKNGLGVVYFTAALFESALDMFQEIVGEAEKYDNKERLEASLCGIGEIYDAMGQPDEALKYYHKALEIVEKCDNPEHTAVILNDLGKNYLKRKNYDEALLYLNKSKALIKGKNLGIPLPQCYILLANVYMENSKFHKAEKSLQKALSHCKSKKYRTMQIEALFNLGLLYDKKYKRRHAYRYYKKALEISIQEDHNIHLKTIYHALSENCKSLKKYKKACEYQNKVNEVTETLFNQQAEQKLRVFKTEYKYSKKTTEREIFILKRQMQE